MCIAPTPALPARVADHEVRLFLVYPIGPTFGYYYSYECE